VTTDPFIVLTSNLFAILGLRAMYFLLAGAAERFSMLKYGLSVILVFIGIKMLIVDFYHIPIAISLGVVFGILIVTLIINTWVNRQHDKKQQVECVLPGGPRPLARRPGKRSATRHFR
jgi:predicted tellurium resistance membrane protein TerC